MPELPEVETTRRGIEPYILKQLISHITVRNPNLRWPVPDNISQLVAGQKVHQVERRAKYLILKMDKGSLLIHLGMSGNLRILEKDSAAGKHDHVDIHLENGKLLRFNDTRRFGAILWTADAVEQHPLIQHLGPEPLSLTFTADDLFNKAKGRSVPIKPFIMNADIVVGVGNIYANEALFLAGIHPETISGKLSKVRIGKLVEAIKQVLAKAIEAGGTTLRDFRKTDGQPGYFAQELNVYGRENQACIHCQTPIKSFRQAQRASYYCPHCQKK